MSSDSRVTESKTGVYRTLERLHKLLKGFEGCKEWPDLINWLNDLKEILKNSSIAKLSGQEILGKRLGTRALNV